MTTNHGGSVRPISVASGRHPFEVASLVAVFTVGVILVGTDNRPASVAASMPAVTQAVWEIGLVFAGLIGLTGVFWPGRLAGGMGVELVGVAVLGAITTMYTIALYSVSGTAALAAGAFVASVAVASWWRVAQILRDLKRIARAIAANDVADAKVLVERNPR